MAATVNRRKSLGDTITIASTSSNGTTADSGNAASFERVTYAINITTATAGSIVFVIQSTADGTNWFDLASGEMSGDTGSISATGTKHISSVGPIGIASRLKYTITTGPFAFTVIPIFEKTGRVHG